MEERIWHRHYDRGTPRSVDYEPVALPDVLRRTAARAPEATALSFLNARLSYRDLLDQVERLAAALAGLGVEPGASVAIHGPNLPQSVIAYYAVLSLGGRVVLTNPLYTPREIEHQWSDAGCVLAVTADFLYAQRLREHRGSLPPRAYVITSVPEYLRFPLKQLAPLRLRRQRPPAWARVPRDPGLFRFRGLIDEAAPRPARPRLDLDAVACLQYTGGTTGRAKGAMLTHRNLSVNVQQLSAWFPEAELGREVVLGALPLFHVFGMTVCMNWAVYTGAELALLPDPRDVKTLVDTVSRRRVTLFPGVPAMFNALCSHEGVEKLDLSSVKSCFSGSAPLPLEVLERFEKLTGSRIVEGFGMTESSPVTHANPLCGLRKVGTVGIPVPDTDARIADPEDSSREMGPGEPGELLIRGPQVMKGYWNRPEETEASLAGGWLHSGDLATMDEDGYFQIVGRKKDMIVASGYNVYPDEVDDVLMAHADVQEAATIGVPDPRRGETVKSFVVLRPGARATRQDLERHCRENLAAYKIPREIEFMDELPKSSVLKVLRRELRERELARRADPG